MVEVNFFASEFVFSLDADLIGSFSPSGAPRSNFLHQHRNAGAVSTGVVIH